MAIKKSELRKVKIQDGYNTVGYFHKWGKDIQQNEGTYLNITVAIVELEDGQIKLYKPEMIKFEN